MIKCLDTPWRFTDSEESEEIGLNGSNLIVLGSDVAPVLDFVGFDGRESFQVTFRIFVRRHASCKL